MGWWSATIMGGDTPYDICDSLEEAKVKTSDEVEVVVKQLLKEWKDCIPRFIDESVVYSVAGAYSLEHGVKLNDDFLQLVIKQTQADRWAKNDAERAMHVNTLVKELKLNNGTGVCNIATEGLFEVAAKHIASGKTGLINVNV